MTVRTSVVRVAWQWRRLVLVVAVVALGSNLVLALRQPLYGSEVRALVQPILPAEALLLRSRYPQEYRRVQFVQQVLLDLSDYVESHRFAAGVAASHDEQFGTRPPPGAIAGTLSAQQVHRTLRISVVTGAAESTYRIAVATAAALEQHGAAFVSDEAGQPRIEVAVITDPAPAAALDPLARPVGSRPARARCRRRAPRAAPGRGWAAAHARYAWRGHCPPEPAGARHGTCAGLGL